MADYGDYSAYDGGSGNYIDLPSWDYDSAFPTFGEDIWSGGGNTYTDSWDPYGGLGASSWIAPYVSPEVFGYQPAQTFNFPQPAGAANIAAPGPQGSGQSILEALLRPQSALGIGAGISGLIGALAGGGQVQSQGPRPTTAQQANMIRGNQLAEQGAMGGMPLQAQQNSLLQAIMSGQGLAQPYAQAVERAFEPALGDLYTRAAQMGRRRGFYDSPATSPPGGAILGPGLADIQGQQARAKLELMQSLPQLFNQPIATQGNFAQNYLRGAQSAPMQTTTTQPLGPTIGQAAGQGLLGLGQVFDQAEQRQRQDRQFQSLIEALSGRRPDSMSGV